MVKGYRKGDCAGGEKLRDHRLNLRALCLLPFVLFISQCAKHKAVGHHETTFSDVAPEGDLQNQALDIIPFTGAGHEQELVGIRNQIPNDRFQAQLGENIKSIQVFSSGGDTDQVLIVSIDWTSKEANGDLEKLIIKAPMSELKVGIKSSYYTAYNEADERSLIRASFKCTNTSCEVMEIYLQLMDSTESHIVGAETGLYYMRTQTHFSVQGVDVENASDGVKALMAAQSGSNGAIKETIEIVDGPSYIRVRIPNPDSPQDLAQSLFIAETELRETRKQLSPVGHLKILKEDFEGQLSGNDRSGNVAFLIRARRPKTEDIGSIPVTPSSDFSLYIGSNVHEDPQGPPGAYDPEKLQGKSIMPIPFGDPSFASTEKSLEEIERYRNNPMVKTFIGYLKGDEKYARCLATTGKAVRDPVNLKPSVENLFHNLVKIREQIQPIFKHLDVPPELVYLTYMESKFAIQDITVDGWFIDEVTPYKKKNMSTATGPFQMTHRTATHIKKNLGVNFETFSLVWRNAIINEKEMAANSSVEPISCGHERCPIYSDHRRYLMTATAGTAVLAKSILNEFKNQPELWPLAYKRGSGMLAKMVQCSTKESTEQESCHEEINTPSEYGAAIRALDRYKHSRLEQVLQYEMAECGDLDYLMKFLALRFIGSDYKAHGFEIKNEKLPKSLPPLYPPGMTATNFFEKMFR